LCLALGCAAAVLALLAPGAGAASLSALRAPSLWVAHAGKPAAIAAQAQAAKVRAQTSSAVARFQARHRLRHSGILDGATWRALLKVHPRVPSWAGRSPDSAG